MTQNNNNNKEMEGDAVRHSDEDQNRTVESAENRTGEKGEDAQAARVERIVGAIARFEARPRRERRWGRR